MKMRDPKEVFNEYYQTYIEDGCSIREAEQFAMESVKEYIAMYYDYAHEKAKEEKYGDSYEYWDDTTESYHR